MMNYIKNLNWRELITADFWFGVDRIRIHTSETAILYIGAALVVLGIITIIASRITKNLFLRQVLGRFAKIFFTIGILEGIWYLLRTQYTAVLGSKAVAVLLLLWGIIWLYWPIKYLLKNYKEDMAKASREASRQEYLTRKR